MQRFNYQLDPPAKARLGLIVLQSDETIESDMRKLLPEEARLFVNRIQSAPEVSRDTLHQMKGKITEAAGLFPQGAKLDVIGYGCTSGTAEIGVANVADHVRTAHQTPMVTQPVSALIAACQHLKISRLAILSPYVEPVSDQLRQTLAIDGIETPVFGSFNEAKEANVSRISDSSLIDAAHRLAEQDKSIKGIFLSCTNLRTLEVIAPLEAETGLPVLSSNLVLAWHMATGTKENLQINAPGRLKN